MNIKLDGHEIIIDDEDFTKITAHTWYAWISDNNKIYFRASTQIGTRIFLHKFLKPGCWSVDHRNRNTLDYRKENLRCANKGQQNTNREKPNRVNGSTSKYKGVYKSKGKWKAKCNRIHLGTFSNEIDAAKAYDKAAKRHQKEYAVLNFPE